MSNIYDVAGAGLQTAERVARGTHLDKLRAFRTGLALAEGAYLARVSASGVTHIEARTGGVRLEVPTRFIPHHLFGDYEPVTSRCVRSTLRTGMVVLDVGAHIGYFTVVAARAVGKSGFVHAVEPSPDNLAFLQRNVALNGLTNVAIHPYAAGSDDRPRDFHITGSSDSHGFYDHPLTDTDHVITVGERRIGSLVSPPIDALKLDVEGAEVDALEGLAETLRQSPGATVWAEWNPACMRRAGRDPMELPEALVGLGFRNLRALDDRHGTVIELDEAVATAGRPDLPASWYVNLWGVRA